MFRVVSSATDADVGVLASRYVTASETIEIVTNFSTFMKFSPTSIEIHVPISLIPNFVGNGAKACGVQRTVAGCT